MKQVFQPYKEIALLILSFLFSAHVVAGPVLNQPTLKCFAMTDNVAELYSFDLDITTPPTKVITDRALNGEAATYRATDNAIYTFHQDLVVQDERKPSDLYKVEMDGTVTLIRAAFTSKKANGAEFVRYLDGTEYLITVQYKNHSTLSVYDATDLASGIPLRTISLKFPNGVDANVDGLAINPNTGEILVSDDLDWDAAIDYTDIYSVNMMTGQLTLVTTLAVEGIDTESLAFAEDGFLYTENEGFSSTLPYRNRIFRIDLSTGDLTPVEENMDAVITGYINTDGDLRAGDIEGMSCTGSKIITPPPTFSCDKDAFLTYNFGLDTAISSFDIASATLTLENSSLISPGVVNAIGYNTTDDYIWGFSKTTAKVVRINSNYELYSYTIPGLTNYNYHVGDVSPEGVLYLYGRVKENTTIYRVDVNPNSPTYLQKLADLPLTNYDDLKIADFAFHPTDGMLYSVDQNAHLRKINPTTGIVSDLGDIQVPGFNNSNISFFDRDGFLYFNDSGNKHGPGTNKIYRIDLSKPAAPISRAVEFYDYVWVMDKADGARCPNAPIGTTLTIKHHVINDNAGTATGSDFVMATNTGEILIEDMASVSGDTTTYTSRPMIITPGNVTITAPNVASYARLPNTWSCITSAGQTPTVTHSIDGSGLIGALDIADGDNMTCTITYDDIGSCSALSGEINVAISPISMLKTESGDYKNKLFVATTDHANNIGNIRAYAIDSDELPASSESWNAAGAMVTQNERGSRLFTSVGSSLVAFNSSALTNDSFQSTGLPTYTTIKSTVIAAVMGRVSPNTNVVLLENDVDSIEYLEEPAYRTFYRETISKRSPLIADNGNIPSQVLVTSDDGFLYSFNQSDGSLKWGWMPPSLALELKYPSSFASQHFMQGEIDRLDLKSGALGSYTFDSYIVGSYHDGLGQYVLKLDSDSSLGSVIWNVDHKASNPAANQSPNHGERAYFSDVNGKRYMAYIITSNESVSKLYIRSMTDTSVTTEVVLSFTATSTPFVMPDLLGSNSPAENTIYLGSQDGNIYSAALFSADNIAINTSISTELSTSLNVIHPSTQSSSAILYLGASVAEGGKYHLHAQAEDRITLFNYNTLDSLWNPSWTTSTGVSLTGKWAMVLGSLEFVADNTITPLPTNSRITDKAYIIASSIVLPVTEAPSDNTVCYGDTYYYFYKLLNGNKPTKTFFSTSAHAAITSGKIKLGKGEAMSMHLTTSSNAKKLIALGLASQNTNSGTGVSETFYIKDPITSGIRSWKELH